ncbi:solute carrier family 23 member 2-like [Amphibalanus amphitrite]|uniref:solute carrier family 23 member 2-like n=1 Tax=Amphibalanus amphitrite TaxID=1232801 RepID=UPI001C901844|nr:solute carrier family 23 member 2-like [Amphibalanus amphitrite]
MAETASTASGDTQNSSAEDRRQHTADRNDQSPSETTDDPSHKLLYGVNDVPPWYTCLLLGLQQFLTMLNGSVAMPLMVTPLTCMADDDPARGYIIDATLFVSGITTLLQATFGTRLPIVQGPSWTYLAPIAAVMHLPEWKCPDVDLLANMSSEERSGLWQPRVNELLGALAVASVIQLLLGATGAVGLLLRFISPITVVCTITVLGIGFFESFRGMMSSHWPVSLLTMFLVILFSQYLRDVKIPFPYCTRTSKGVIRVPIFKLLPVLLSIMISWSLCAILTHADILPVGSAARTDHNLNALSEAVWLQLPLIGRWGAPTVHIGPVLGMTAAVLASIVESIGDYYSCAKISGASAPPVHAMNRGIAIEGLGGILSGLFGAANASTSYSGNIGIIGVTRVGSRRVVQLSAIFMILFGLVGKFGALFVSIPAAIYGGAFVALFAMIAGIGLSPLQYIDMNSPRNMYVVGFSILIALVIPGYIEKNPTLLTTGIPTLDHMSYVVLSTAMFVAGLISAVLDNTIPGTDKERGVDRWRALTAGAAAGADSDPTYRLPWGMHLLERWRWTRLLPFSPTFEGFPELGDATCCRRPRSRQCSVELKKAAAISPA